MSKYRVTAQANGKEVIEELEAVSADVAWTIIDEKYNRRLHDGLVEELPTREEQAATIAQLREVATAAREVMRKHDAEAVKRNFTICGCDYCDAMRPQLAALEQETK